MKIFHKQIFILFIFLISYEISYAQEDYKTFTAEQKEKIYEGGNSYEVKIYPDKFKKKKPKNVILMIGDGMGVSHVFGAITANKGSLYLQNFHYIGFSTTQSANRYTTDSSAGGTALACGTKTYNSGLGVNTDTIPVKSILEKAEDSGLSTGLVSTSSITHATPASFIAHQPNRISYEAIAADFLNTDIDVFIGGGYRFFTEREDGRDLVNELSQKGYNVLQDIDEITKVESGKLAGLTSYEHNPRYAERGDILPMATETAIDILDNNKKGFFLMVEGSQIDWGSHQNNTNYIIEEMFDFDKAIGKALEFAAEDGNTLIIVTADHETGGFTLIDGDLETGRLVGSFASTHHTGVMVPVFAYGPGAQNFTGIMDNTDIFKKIEEFLIK